MMFVSIVNTCTVDVEDFSLAVTHFLNPYPKGKGWCVCSQYNLVFIYWEFSANTLHISPQAVFTFRSHSNVSDFGKEWTGTSSVKKNDRTCDACPLTSYSSQPQTDNFASFSGGLFMI